MPKSSLFDLDEGVENIPVIKGPAQAVKSITNSAAKYTKQQAQAVTKAFISQLYGSSNSSSTDVANQIDSTVNDPLTQLKKNQPNIHPASQQQSSQVANTSAHTPEEETKIQETRRKINQQHVSQYYDALFGRVNDVEQDVKKEENKRKQAEQQRAQEELEEKRRKEQELQQRKQQFVAPTGKGRNKMKQPDLAATRARTKTEMKTAGAG